MISVELVWQPEMSHSEEKSKGKKQAEVLLLLEEKFPQAENDESILKEADCVDSFLKSSTFM